MTGPPGAPPAPLSARARWHRGANLVVLAWLLLAAATAALGGLLPVRAPWLPLHMLLLGAATTAVLVWSEHFAVALLRAAEPVGRSRVARLVLLQVGAVLVLAGVTAGGGGAAGWVVVAGAGHVVAAIGWHTLALGRLTRGALGGRFAPVVGYYLAAGAALIGGVVPGTLMAVGVGAGPWPVRLYAAHVHLMLLGWLGLTVLGTLVTLWPTALRTRLAPGAEPAARRAWWLLAGGLSVAVFALLAGVGRVAVAGLVGYAAGVVVLLVPLVRAALARPPHTGAAWMLATGAAWQAGLVGADAVLLAVSPDLGTAIDRVAEFVPSAAAGFAGQVVLGALTFLLPVVIGGGPRAVRANTERLERAWRPRLLGVQLGLVLTLLPAGWGGVGWWHRLGWALVLLAGPVPFVASSLLVLVFRRTPVADMPDSRPDSRPGSRPLSDRRPALGGVALGLVMLLVAVVVAQSGRAGGAAADRPAGAVGGAGVAGSSQAMVMGTPASAGTRTIAVTLRGMRVHPSRVEVPSGTHVVLQVTNADAMRHDLAVDAGARTRMLGRGQSDRLDLGTVTKAVEAYCTVPGHRQAGMTMTVLPAGASGAGSSTSALAAPSPLATGRPDAVLDPSAPWPAGFTARDPDLPPAPAGAVRKVRLEVIEKDVTVAPGVVQHMWTFGGTVPGPVIHARLGQTVEVTLVNKGTMEHSIDFHAGSVGPDPVMRSIAPGQSLLYRFTADQAGVWMYHCATAPMLEHVGNGMYGAVVVDPPGLNRVDHEYVMVQSELAFGPPGGPADAAKLAAGRADAVAFNGKAFQYDTDPLRVRAGDRVRVWVLDAGPNLATSFHIVGTRYDTVFFEGAYLLRRGNAERGGSQTLGLQPAQGGFVETTIPAPGHYPFLSHRLADAARGAHGVIEVR